MATVFSDSSLFYSQQRRRRMRQQAYGDSSAEIGALVGAETAAFSDGSAFKSIAIGVATGVLTFLINHWLEKTLK